MAKEATEEQQILVRFIANPSIPDELKVKSDQMAIPADLTRYGLSQTINALLGLEKVIPFDFEVEQHLVREPLHSLVTFLGISAELVLDVVYSLAVMPPKQESKQPQDDWVSTVCGLPAGEVVSGGYDGLVRLWTGDGKQSSIAFQAHRGRITSSASLPAADAARLLVTSGTDGSACVWRLRSSDDLADTADAASESAAEKIADYRGHVDSIAALAVQPAGRRFATCGWDGLMNIWDTGDAVTAAEDAVEAASSAKRRKVRKGAAVASELTSVLEVVQPALQLSGHKQCVSGAVWHREDRIVSCSWDRSVRLWDTATSVNHATLNHNRAVHSVATPPGSGDGIVAFGGAESGLRLWDPRSEGETLAVRTLSGHSNWISAITWHPISQHHLVTASHDMTLRLWDLRSTMALHTIKVHTEKVLCAAWLDNKHLASGGADNQMVVHTIQL